MSAMGEKGKRRFAKNLSDVQKKRDLDRMEEWLMSVVAVRVRYESKNRIKTASFGLPELTINDFISQNERKSMIFLL